MKIGVDALPWWCGVGPVLTSAMRVLSVSILVSRYEVRWVPL